MAARCPQLALQAEQLAEVEPAVKAPFGGGTLRGRLEQQLVEPFVVQFHFKLFIEAVEQFGLDALGRCGG